MNHPRLRRFLSLLFSFSLIQGLFAGESVTFPTYSTATINSGTTGVTTPLTVSSVPSNDYLFVSVTGDFAPGAGAAGIYSNDMLMELSDGGSNVYWPGTKATHGTISGAVTGNWAGAAALKWHGLLPKTYPGGTSLSVRFYSPAGGTG